MFSSVKRRAAAQGALQPHDELLEESRRAMRCAVLVRHASVAERRAGRLRRSAIRFSSGGVVGGLAGFGSGGLEGVGLEGYVADAACGVGCGVVWLRREVRVGVRTRSDWLLVANLGRSRGTAREGHLLLREQQVVPG